MLLAYVCIYPTSLTHQYLTLYASILWQIVFIGVVQPFKSQRENSMTLFNEVVIMICLYWFICFSDFVPDVNTRFMIGYVCSTLVCAHFIISISLILAVNIKTCKQKRREKLLQQRRTHLQTLRQNLQKQQKQKESKKLTAQKTTEPEKLLPKSISDRQDAAQTVQPQIVKNQIPEAILELPEIAEVSEENTISSMDSEEELKNEVLQAILKNPNMNINQSISTVRDNIQNAINRQEQPQSNQTEIFKADFNIDGLMKSMDQSKNTVQPIKEKDNDAFTASDRKRLIVAE